MNSSVSYFDLLEIPEGYLIEEKVLRQQFLKKSRETHPDFFSLSSDEIKSEKEIASAQLNEAWNTLRDPELRLSYLFSLFGFQVEDIKPDATVLMEMMEWNEQLEMATEEGSLQKIKAELQEVREERRGKLAKHFTEWNSLSKEEKLKRLELAKTDWIVVRYYSRILSGKIV